MVHNYFVGYDPVLNQIVAAGKQHHVSEWGKRLPDVDTVHLRPLRSGFVWDFGLASVMLRFVNALVGLFLVEGTPQVS
jgi:hypothetical protein